MKFTRIAMAVAVSCGMTGGIAFAEGLQYPSSVRPVALEYDYYSQDENGATASPSDVAIAAEANAPIDYAADYSSCDEDSAFKIWNPDNNCWGIDIGGFSQIGYHTEGNSANNDAGTGLFNNNPNEVQLQQQWLYVEKAMDLDCNCWDWGFRVDGVYGTDGPNTQAFGGRANEWDNPWDYGNDYGIAHPQAYVEVGRGDWKIKAGHFFTIAGYEVVPATGNFFYSHAYTMNNAEPFTHTGALAEYGGIENLTLWGGWTAGWDTGFATNEGNVFLGGFSYNFRDSITFTYTTTLGDFGFANGVGNGSDFNGYSHSVVVDMAVTDRFNYVIQSDYIDNDQFVSGATGDSFSTIIGVNNYFLYTINDCWKAGVRAEWFKQEGSGEVFATTLGVNYTPNANLTVRPEVRFDDYKPGAPRADGTIFGIDAIVTY
jgi:hypothetical protein